jgi:hypothetical protein
VVVAVAVVLDDLPGALRGHRVSSIGRVDDDDRRGRWRHAEGFL